MLQTAHLHTNIMAGIDVELRDFRVPLLLAVLFLGINLMASPSRPHIEVKLPHVPHLELDLERLDDVWVPTKMFVLFLFLCLAAVASLRMPPLVSAALWVAIPLALMPTWVMRGRDPDINWAGYIWASVKTWSVILTCIWFGLCYSMPARFPSSLAGHSLWISLVINIIEAVVWDAMDGHYMNAAAGLLLCISILPRAQYEPNIRRRYGFYVLEFDLPWLWIISYTIWNSCFT